MSLLNEKELRRDYYQKDLTQVEIAEKHDCSRRTVSKRMDEYNMPRLPSLSVREEGARRYYRSDGEEFVEYQLLAIADGADPHDVFGDAHIHHINGCPRDNRIENIAVLTPEEHGMVEHTDMEVDDEDEIIYKPLKLQQSRS